MPAMQWRGIAVKTVYTIQIYNISAAKNNTFLLLLMRLDVEYTSIAEKM